MSVTVKHESVMGLFLTLRLLDSWTTVILTGSIVSTSLITPKHIWWSKIGGTSLWVFCRGMHHTDSLRRISTTTASLTWSATDRTITRNIKDIECSQYKLNMRYIPSVLWHCWLGDRKGIRPVKKTGCWFVGDLRKMVILLIWLELCTSYSSSSPVVATTSIILCFNKHWLTQVHLENGR